MEAPASSKTEQWNTGETRRASGPGFPGGRSLFSCDWTWTDRPPNRTRLEYEKKGFVATGVEDEDEIELVLSIT